MYSSQTFVKAVLMSRIGTIDYEDWASEASCKGKLDLFYPDEDDVEYRKKIYKAKSLCVNCPVKVSCLTFAITRGESHGVWGGMTFRQISRLRNQIGVIDEDYIQNYLEKKVFNV